MIKARNIHKHYGSVEVLRGIDIDIAPRRITSIVGPSGAGKTTLLQILGTIASPDKGGQVIFGNKDLSSLSDKELSLFRNRNIGFVFQAHRLLPEFSIRENVAIPALIAGMPRHEALLRADSLLSTLGLEHRTGHRPAELSGGECQRAAVARALMNEPQVIMADEPSGSLDLVNRTALHRIFFDLKEQLGVTFVIVTHDENLAAGSDTIIHMADGRIVDIKNRIPS